MSSGKDSMCNSRMPARVAHELRQANRIGVTSHVRPDADCIGSGLALCDMLRQMGKEVAFLNIDPAPFPLTRLPGFESIEYRQIHPDPFDVLVLIEGSTEDRNGQRHLDQYRTINIDHHATGGKNADINWVCPDTGAVGELIYQLGIELGIDFTPEIAFNLYAAIASDTGSFKYSNTTYRSLFIASELVRLAGINPSDVGNLLFYSNPLEKVRLIQKVLSTLELTLGGQVCIIRFERGFLPHLSLNDIETEDIVSIARSILGVRMTLFFKEIGENRFRVSMRSKGEMNAQKVALRFGGGGHDHAAGFFFSGTLDQARREVLEAVKEQLS